MDGPSTPTPSRRRQQTPPVFLRDFAYPDNGPSLLPEPMRAARGNISTTSASQFAGMSHFLGTPTHSRVWALKHSEYVGALQHAKTSRDRLLSGPMVDIYVGPERKHWSLHRNLLCHHSSYFEAEFQGHEVPKKENTLELPDEDPRGFELFVKWLYQGTLDDASHMTEEAKYEYAVACHKLYQLCDKFDMIHVKNLSMDAYRSNLHQAQLVPDAEEINEIYHASPRGSPFRKLMTKIAARQIMDPGVDKDAESYRSCFENNPDFAVEMVNAIRYMSGGMLFDDPTKDEDCAQWHDHRDGSRCYLKGKGKVYVDQGTHMTPGSTPGRRRPQPQFPMIAELSERPTPRKLGVTPQHAKTRGSALAQMAQKPAALPNGHVVTPARRVASAAAAEQQPNAPPAGDDAPPTPARAKQAEPNSAKKLANRPRARTDVQPTGVARKGPPGPNKASSLKGSPPKPQHHNVNAIPSNKPSGFNGIPPKMSNVNGLARQSEATNGVAHSFRSSSQDDASDGGNKKPPPPKLKRKAPG